MVMQGKACFELAGTKSEVFARQFQLVRETDPLGHPLFVVNVK
jgi:hypothetical protein